MTVTWKDQEVEASVKYTWRVFLKTKMIKQMTKQFIVPVMLSCCSLESHSSANTISKSLTWERAGD